MATCFNKQSLNALTSFSGLADADYEHISCRVVVVYFILSRLLYLAFSANLGLLCMPHPGMGPLV